MSQYHWLVIVNELPDVPVIDPVNDYSLDCE